MGKVKYDKDPSNDYQDGYNAGRRYQAKSDKKQTVITGAILVLCALIGFLLGSAIANALKSPAQDQQKNCKVTVVVEEGSKVYTLPEVGGGK